jgi:hypothetical protein
MPDIAKAPQETPFGVGKTLESAIGNGDFGDLASAFHQNFGMPLAVWPLNFESSSNTPERALRL